MRIETDDLTRPQVHALLQEHLDDMYALSPPESVHALDLARLRGADITFWTLWSGDELLGCGALKALDAHHGEIKSMRTVPRHLRKGVAAALLAHIIDEATQRRYGRLSLETGSMAAFAPARALYAGFGFVACGPFADYVEDPYSVFMSKDLSNRLDVS